MMGNHRMLCTFTLQQIGMWLLHTPKRIPTFMAMALLSLGNYYTMWDVACALYHALFKV